MSNININPADLKHFAFVVDNVVQRLMSIPAPETNTQEGNALVELWQSRPVIIEVPQDVEDFGVGYLWDGTTFNPPA